MEYVYPAIFSENADGSYTITFPDLPGCISEGKSLPDALAMASKALSQWIEYLSDEGQPVPPTIGVANISAPKGAFVNLVYANVRGPNAAVRRTVSIPQWMDEAASEKGMSLSKVLQDALQNRLAH